MNKKINKTMRKDDETMKTNDDKTMKTDYELTEQDEKEMLILRDDMFILCEFGFAAMYKEYQNDEHDMSFECLKDILYDFPLKKLFQIVEFIKSTDE